mgnify:FL=1
MQSSLKKVGWIGTGVMGKSMCDHLLKAGYPLYVYNRTSSKADDLVAKGAKFMSPAEIAKNCEIIFLMLGYPHDVKKMVLEEGGLLEHLKSGSIIVDHTTSSPSLAQEIYKKCKEKGVSSIDAPVSGGDVGAKNGTLAVMAGGDKEIFDEVTPIMKNYSATMSLLGDAGMGQHTKMFNQICIAGTMIGVVEGLVYGHKAGLDLTQAIKAIENGAAGSFSLKVLAPRMLARNFDPGFFVEHFVKDMEIALDEARRVNLCLPGLSLVKQFYQALMAQGGAKNGTQALLLVLEKLNNIEIPKQEPKKDA